MAVDRYIKVVLTLIAISLGMLAIRPFVEPPVVFSQLSEDDLKSLREPPKPEEVSKAWGRFVGTFVVRDGRFVTFEAGDGTLRTTRACMWCDVVRK